MTFVAKITLKEITLRCTEGNNTSGGFATKPLLQSEHRNNPLVAIRDTRVLGISDGCSCVNRMALEAAHVFVIISTDGRVANRPTTKGFVAVT